MPFCTQCGNRNPEGSRFCSQCGTPLEAAAAAAPPTEASTPLPAAAEPIAAPEAEQGPPPSVTDSSATITFGVPQTDDDRGLDDDDAAAVDALPTGSALLVVQRGPGAGNRFLLDQEVVTAGRHPDSEIFLDDITVSRRHVEFRSTGDGYTVTDVGSLNGTYVNRDRIEESTLQNGDEVQIGKFRLVFFAGDGHQDI
ncbi:MAG: signal peptide protein [Nocardioidaceae bacterium]|nr:signal peptide protein [Nocardioidaceae bacterium]